MHRSLLSRIGPLAVLFAAVIAISCSDITGPSAGSSRYARGLSFRPVFAGLQTSEGVGAFDLVPFARVRIVLHHEDGSIALDTVVDFPPDATELTLSLDVRLAPTAPASGEPLSLNLAYINAAGDTVFRGGPTSIIAIPSVAGAPPPPPVNIPVQYTGTGSTATRVVITPHALSVFAGDPFAFSAQAQDASGAAIPGTPIVFTSNNSALAELTSSSGGSGVSKPGRGAVTITAALLTGPTHVGTLTVQPRPSAIGAVSGAGQTALVGSTLLEKVVARVTATDGLGVSGVAVSFAATGGGTPGSSTVVTDADGRAETTWKLGPIAGQQTMTATATGISGGAAFTANATPLPATKLAVITQPTSTTAGQNIGPVTVAAVDVNDNIVSSFSGTISIAIGANPGGGTLTGVTSVAATSGQATFPTLSISKTGNGYTLVGTTTGLTAATSSTFNIGSGQAVRIEITTQPTNGVAGAPLAPVVVTARDAAGNTATSYTGTVGMSITTNPGAATLSGTPSVNAVAGVATFSNLRLNKAGNGYSLLAGAPGVGGEPSIPFNIVPAAPATCDAVSGNNQTGIAGALLPPILVASIDAFGNKIPNAGIDVTVTSGGGSVAPLTFNANGDASIAWTLGPTIGVQTLNVVCQGVAAALPITANAIPGVAGPATQLFFSIEPGTATAGAIAPTFTVTARDINNLTATSFTGNISITLGTNPGGATLIGTLTRPAPGGVATFNDIRLNKIGVGYTLNATSLPVLTPTNSAGFTVVAAPAIQILADSGSGQNAPASTTLPNRLVVRVLDSLANPVSGTPVTWAIASGGGTLTPPTGVTTDINGRARVQWTLGAVGGAQTVTATSGVLAGSPVLFTATATGAPVSLVWNGSVDTLWTNPANWTPAQVPTPVDSVTIQSTGNYAAIIAPVTVHHMTVNNCASVSNHSTLTITGNWVDSSQFCGGPGATKAVVRTSPTAKRMSPAKVVFGTGVVVLTGNGNLMGHMQASDVQITGGTHTVIGLMNFQSPVTISGGQLDVGSNVVTTLGLTTSGSGTLRMTAPAGNLFVDGPAVFGGGSETGLLTAGSIEFEADFSASGTAYDAGLGHTAHIESCDSPQTVNFTAPVANHGFGNLVFACGGTKNITGAPTVMGDLTIFANSSTITGSTILLRGSIVNQGSLAWHVANTLMDSNGEIGSGIYNTNLTIIGGTVENEVDDFTEIIGNVTVTGATAVLNLNASTLAINGNFATASGGRIIMTDNSDVLDIGGDATFAGGSTTGQITDGFLYVLGNFTQAGGAPDAFAPSLNHQSYIGTSEFYDPFLIRAASKIKRPVRAAPKASVRTPLRPATMRAIELATQRLTRARTAASVRGPSVRGSFGASRSGKTIFATADGAQRLARALARAPGERASHPTRIVAKSLTPCTVHFANPGAGAGTSHFSLLIVATIEVDLTSDMFVNGPIFTTGGPVIAGSNNELTTMGAVVDGVEFNSVRWNLMTGSSVLELDDVSFVNMDPTVNQFTVQRTGDPGDFAVSLVNWFFDTTPTTGNYISATDINGPAPHALDIDMVFPTPATSGGHIQLINGATTNWSAFFEWFGGGSTADWNDAGNWTTESIPGPFDDVIIRSDALQNPVVDDGGAVTHNLTIQAGRTIDATEGALAVFGNLIAPVNVESVIGGPMDLIGDGGVNTVVGWVNGAMVTGNYSVSGPGSQFIVTTFLEMLGATANLTVNGGRVDVGGPGGLLGSGIFQTVSGGTLTMTNPADQVYLGGIGAFFDGASTAGRLTAGTLNVVATLLRTSAGPAAPDAYAPSGSHRTVFSGSNEVEFFNPVASHLHNAELVANADVVLVTDALVTGTLSHTGVGAAAILSTSAGVLQTLTVSGLSNTQPLTMSSVAIKLVNGTPNATFDNVTWIDFPSNFTGNVFDVNRSDAGTLTFTNHNFLDVTLGTGGHFLVNRGSANVHMATPQPGTVTTQVQQLGTGVIIWP